MKNQNKTKQAGFRDPNFLRWDYEMRHNFDKVEKLTYGIPKSMDSFIVRDIKEEVVEKNISLDQHIENVLKTHRTYGDVPKHIYSEILYAFQKVISHSTRKRKTLNFKKSIVFLHREIALSPYTIQLIAKLFGKHIPTRAILDASSEFLDDDIQINIIVGGRYH